MNRDERRKLSKKARVASLEVVTRECCGDDEEKCEKKCVRASCSSESPCPEYVYDEDKQRSVYANEILGHTPEEVDMSRCRDGLVIQDGHGGDQIGIIREVKLENGRLCGDIEFCCGKRAQEVKQDAIDGIRRNMSVGYMVKKWKKISDGDPATGEPPTYRAVRWTPYEASFVNVPADAQVGVERALYADDETETAAQTAAQTERTLQMEKPVEAPAVEPAIDVGAELRALKDEVVQIRALAEKPVMPAAKPAPQFDEGEAKKVQREYDLLKAVRVLAGIRGADAGFEREISDEIAKKTGREARGFFIPECVLQRAFDKGTNAGNLVATDTLFNELVPALVAKTVLGQAGVRSITGLVGDIEIPTAGSATAYWVSAEGGDATESTPAIGQKQASPKTIGAYTDITRKLMLQSGIGPQMFVADALRSALGRGIETAAFSGSGSSGQPTGLDNASISTIANATDPSLSKILEFISTIEGDNAEGPNMKFIGRPNVWATLGAKLDWTAVTASDANVGGVTSGKYLLDTATNTMQGYTFLKSNLATAKYLYFGDWSKLLFCFWSGIDLTVDNSSLSKSGGVRLVALQDMDIVCTQPKAFARGQVIAS